MYVLSGTCSRSKMSTSSLLARLVALVAAPLAVAHGPPMGGHGHGIPHGGFHGGHGYDPFTAAGHGGHGGMWSGKSYHHPMLWFSILFAVGAYLYLKFFVGFKGSALAAKRN